MINAWIPELSWSSPSRNMSWSTFLLPFNLYILCFQQVHSLPNCLAEIPGSAKESPTHAHSTPAQRLFFSKPSQLCASQECKHLHFTRGTAIMIQNTPNQCVQIWPINAQWENMTCDCLCSLNRHGWIILPPLKAAESNTGLTLFFKCSIRVL